jgi:phospholipase C
VTPTWADNDHPGAPIGQGQAWVTRLVNAVMKGPEWKSTAIFLAWDDWGGFTTMSGRRASTPAATGCACRPS